MLTYNIILLSGILCSYLTFAYINAGLGSLVANVSLSDAFLLLLLSPYFITGDL